MCSLVASTVACFPFVLQLACSCNDQTCMQLPWGVANDVQTCGRGITGRGSDASFIII